MPVHYNLSKKITNLAHVRASCVVPGQGWVGGPLLQIILISYNTKTVGGWACFTIHYNLFTHITKLAHVRAPFCGPWPGFAGWACFAIHTKCITSKTKPAPCGGPWRPQFIPKVIRKSALGRPWRPKSTPKVVRKVCLGAPGGPNSFQR